MQKTKQIKAPKFQAQHRDNTEQQQNQVKLSFSIGFNPAIQHINNTIKQNNVSKQLPQKNIPKQQEKNKLDNDFQIKKLPQKQLPKQQQSNQGFDYNQIDSDDEEFLQTLEEGVEEKVKFVPNLIGNHSKAPNGQVQVRGRSKEREQKSSYTNVKRQRSKEFQQELAKCGGLLHKDPTLRPPEALNQTKNSQVDNSRQETRGPIIFPFQRRTRSFSPKRELSFGGQVNLFNPGVAASQQKEDVTNSTLNTSQSKIEPIKACAESFEKQKIKHQLQSLKMLKSNFLFAQNTSYLIEEPKNNSNDPFNGISTVIPKSQGKQAVKEGPKKKVLKQMEKKEDPQDIQEISLEDILKQIEMEEEFQFQKQQ